MRGFAAWLGMVLLPMAALCQTPPQTRTHIPPGPLVDRSVVVTDHGKHSIVELYVSPQTADAWGSDQLGDAVLDVGVQRVFALGKTRDCGFDLLAVYDDLSREEQRGMNLCKTHAITFDGKTATVPPDALGPAHTVTVVDKTPMPIQQLFISPQDAAQWGDDLLSTAAMSVNEQRKLTFHGPCSADIRAVFANRAAEERRGVDLCAMTTLRIAPGWTTMDLPLGTP